MRQKYTLSARQLMLAVFGYYVCQLTYAGVRDALGITLSENWVQRHIRDNANMLRNSAALPDGQNNPYAVKERHGSHMRWVKTWIYYVSYFTNGFPIELETTDEEAALLLLAMEEVLGMPNNWTDGPYDWSDFLCHDLASEIRTSWDLELKWKEYLKTTADIELPESEDDPAPRSASRTFGERVKGYNRLLKQTNMAAAQRAA